MKSALLSSSIIALAAALAAPAFAADAPPAPASDAAATGEIIVTGTRQTGVKAVDSAAPIELVGAVALTRTGSTDLASSLATSVPSLNIQTTGGDLAALSIQAALRGLSPNDTLVLVDGKRRHTTSSIAVLGGSPYSGAATTDLSFIPVASIDHVEVLTDGAAAQYGTDAVAGVVNIITKKADHGGSISVTGGEYYGGGGETANWSLNKGFSLGDKGFANVTVEERYHNYSITGTGDARFQNADGSLIPQTYPSSNVTKAANFPKENGVNGDPEFNIYDGFFNAGYNLTDDIQAYAFGSYGQRIAQHYENYRTPTKVSGVAEGSETTIYPFPNGFDPSEQIKETDYSITGGVKGTAMGWNWDLSSTYGSDNNQIYVVDSANAQLYPVLQALSATPIVPQTTFYNGAFITTELTNTLDFENSFQVGLAKPLSVAFGFEQRRETYSISAGEPSSYYGAGAQSFDGYTPGDQGSHARTNYAGYVDLATDPIQDLHVDLAGRYEHYSDFGNTTVGKLTARYDFTPAFAIRGTVSTGFRAPTLAEEYYSGTNVSPYSADVQLPANSAAAQVAGFAPLKPEKSTNYSIGFVAHPIPKLQITADIYQIDLKDRILASGFIYGTNTLCVPNNPPNPLPPAKNGCTNQIVTISQGVLDAIAKKGVTLDSGLSYTGISVFTNAADTRTRGAEVTANYASDFGDLGHVDWSLGFNYNKTDITRVEALPAQVSNAAQGQSAFLTPNAASALTTAIPEEKVILQAFWTLGKWSVNLREDVYGPASQWSSNNKVDEKIGVTGITDLDIAYKVTSSIKVDVGANNLFDTIPPTAGPEAGGRVYKVPYSFSPWGTNGGYYYGRVTYTF